MILQRFDNVSSAAARLAHQIAETLRSGIAGRGRASVAVAGGRTPVPMFHALRDADLEWSRVGVTLTDERWVPESSSGSNAALVRDELLVGAARAARFMPLYDGTDSAAAAVQSVWSSLDVLVRPFDAVVLGMGEDGHFASLFPGNDGLVQALDARAAPGCVAMCAPVEPVERISLNLAALLQTRRLFLFVTGLAKRELLMSATRDEVQMRWPVAALLAQRRPFVEVYWAP